MGGFEANRFRFRVWDNDNGQYQLNGAIGSDPQNNGIFQIYASPGCTIEQSTGLLDSQGREIFEGDVVEIEWESIFEFEKAIRGVVEWCDDSAGYIIDFLDYGVSLAVTDENVLSKTIIGTIHDRPSNG